MEIRKTIKKTLTDAAICYMIITAVYSLLMLIVNVTEDGVYLSAQSLVLFFLFSVLASVAQQLFRSTRLSGGTRLLLHFGILILAFYLCFLLPQEMRAAQVLIGLVAFTVVYGIVMAIGAFFRSRFRANAEQEAPYTSQYKGKR